MLDSAQGFVIRQNTRRPRTIVKNSPFRTRVLLQDINAYHPDDLTTVWEN